MSTKYRRKGDILRIGSKRKRIHHVWLSGWPKRVFSINFEPKKVTTNLKSTKYDRANAFDIPVIKRQSIYDAWKQRANPKFEFNDKFYKKYIYDVSIFEIFYRPSLIRVANPAKNLEWYFSGAPKTLRVVRTQTILFSKSSSGSAGSDMERFWI